MNELTSQIGVVWSYAAPVFGAALKGAIAALSWSSIPWVVMAFALGLWLPRDMRQATGQTWVGAGFAALVAFFVAAVGYVLVGGA